MKKIILAVALATCLTFLCASAEVKQSAENVEYAPISFSFWCESAAGYEWSCEYEEDGILEAPFEEMVEGEDGQAKCEFSFGVRKSGTTTLIFNYCLSYGMAPPEKTVICIVAVDEAGDVRVRWVERFSGDNMLLISLPSNPTSGYNWDYAGDTAGIVTLVSEEYSAYDPYLEGAGGTTRYNLRADVPGETILLFNYADMWDPAAAAEESFAVFVDVSQSGEISLSVDEP